MSHAGRVQELRGGDGYISSSARRYTGVVLAVVVAAGGVCTEGQLESRLPPHTHPRFLIFSFKLAQPTPDTPLGPRIHQIKVTQVKRYQRSPSLI